MSMTMNSRRTRHAISVLMVFAFFSAYLIRRREITSTNFVASRKHHVSHEQTQVSNVLARLQLNQSHLGCYENTTRRLVKTVNSRTPRFFLLAGLEHTGHHLWGQGIVPEIKNANASIRSAGYMDHERFQYTKRLSLSNMGWDCGLDEKLPVVHGSSRTMQTAWQQMFETEMASTDVYNSIHIGFCSYPCHKWTKLYEGMNPDLVSVSKAAERARADLRIAVLVRPVIKIMHEFNTDRAKVYASACWELVSQLEAIDPRFYACFPYDGYRHLTKNSTALAAASQFLSGSDDGHRFASTLSSAIDKTYHPSRRSYDSSLWDPVDKDVRLELEICARKLEKVANCEMAWNLGG